MDRQGYNFKGAKTKRLMAVLNKAKNSPEFARKLVGLKPKKEKK